MGNRITMTTTGGAPVSDNQNSLSAGPRGPLLPQDWQLIEKLAHQNRERIPERVVLAKGSAAYGALTVTHDFTRFTKARLFESVGRMTDVFLRFSSIAGARGAAGQSPTLPATSPPCRRNAGGRARA